MKLLFTYAFIPKTKGQLITSGSTNANESLRSRLEDILKQMLVVWAQEGVALKSVTGRKSGKNKFTKY